MNSRSVLTLVTAGVLAFSVATFADDFRMRAGESNPAAMGVVHANTDRNGNLAIEWESKHLAPPDRLSTPHSVYVVWVQPAGKQPGVLGQLRVSARYTAASFKTSVPQLRHFCDR